MNEPAADRLPAPNPVLREILDTGRVRGPDGDPLELHSGVPEDVGRFLQRLVLETRPRVSVEVGLAYGVSCLFLCDALVRVGAVRHIVMDPYQSEPSAWRGIGLRNLERAGYGGLVRFHERPAHLVLAQLEEEGTRIDFGFVDSWHTFDHTLVEFFHLDRLLRVGGLLVFDDVDMPSVSRACRFILTNRAYELHEAAGSAWWPRREDAPGSGSASGWGLSGPLRRLPGLERLLGARPPRPEGGTEADEPPWPPDARSLALRKTSDDHRAWDHYVPF